jgi:two-component system LytT family response regulator
MQSKVTLSSMERLLAPYEYLRLIGSFTDPNQAWAILTDYPADAIFLDIDMKFINGLDVAVRMRRFCPDAEIVFVTNKPHYAIEAFNLNAIDYLLKPIEQGRLDKTIMKLLRRNEKRQLH